MPICQSEFYESAKELIGGGREIDFRNATSRAYYSAFHSCEAIVQSLGIPKYSDSSGGVHAQIIDSLENCSSGPTEQKRKLKSVGYMLRQAKAYRVMADYSLTIPFDEETANATIKQVDRIMNKVIELLSEEQA